MRLQDATSVLLFRCINPDNTDLIRSTVQDRSSGPLVFHCTSGLVQEGSFQNNIWEPTSQLQADNCSPLCSV